MSDNTKPSGGFKVVSDGFGDWSTSISYISSQFSYDLIIDNWALCIDTKNIEKDHTQAANINMSEYTKSSDGLKVVSDGFRYWTTNLSTTSIQFSYALIAGNWAVFGDTKSIIVNNYSLYSLAIVFVFLALNLIYVKIMSYCHLKRYNQAENNLGFWEREFSIYKKKHIRNDPWPITPLMESLSLWMRWVKTLLPLTSAFFFILAISSLVK
jgi:hypothetical protein